MNYLEYKMTYHVHNYLKLKVFLAISEITENGGFADINTITEMVDGDKRNIARSLTNYYGNGYVTRRKYKSCIDKCRYYYQLTDVGINTLKRLYGRYQKGQSLNLRKEPEPITEYVRGIEQDEYKKQLREKRRQEMIDSVLVAADKIVMASCKKVAFQDEDMNEDIESLKVDLRSRLEECITVG